MVGYLAGTGEKVEAVVGAASGRGADGEKVRIVSSFVSRRGGRCRADQGFLGLGLSLGVE